MPQPLESGIYGHQRGDDLHAVVPAATTGVNLPGNLVEVVPHAGKLPSLSPALLRQLAGMGNNLNQIARQVNAGGGSGHDRVQVVAALMAIDAGLERLRHAVLEKDADDDR